VAADISARLAQVAKDPPELSAYLQIHAECVVQALQPVGLAYEMATGQNFQRTFTHNYESLNLRDTPAQDLSFQRSVRAVAESGKPIFLDANMEPAGGLHGLTPDDAPAPENLPLHNLTPYQQIFVPIPLNKKVVGVLHAWFAPADATMANARIAILAHACAEVELYLKSRRISDISQELSRISTYARFLEDVAGDQDLESVAWKLVNYAREAVGCDRVCMLIDSRYGLTANAGLPASDRLALQACSGLRRPHARSEHADVLKGHASELLKLAVVRTPEPPADAARANAPKPDAAPKDGKPAVEPAKPVAASGSTAEAQPQMRIIFTTRDPAKVATRPEAVNRYFEVIDMNWSTVLPLYDRDNRVCGTLLFEGQQSHDKMAALFMQMRDLAVSGGRALSTALVWHRRRTLRGARVLMRWRDQLMGSSRQRLAIKYGLPTLLAAALLVYPFNYRVAGDAILRPVNVQTVSALTEGRLMEVNAREGDRVKKGQILCVLETAALRLQLQQVEQERQRSETEAARALGQDRSEVNMQIARLTARRAEILAEKLRRDIEFAVVKAPFDGVLIGPLDLAKRKGQIIRIGDTLAEIVDPALWEVNVSVREEDVPKLVDAVNAQRAVDPKSGVPGELVLAANPNDVYPLTLTDPTSFSHRLDITGGRYNFSAIIPLAESTARKVGVNPGSELKTGYTGRVKFLCGRRPGGDILFGDFVRFMKLHFF
jgi:biotin carboxyl carrier protein